MSAWLSCGGSPNDWRTDEMVEVLGRLTTERDASSPKPGTPFDLVVVEAIWPGTTVVRSTFSDRPSYGQSACVMWNGYVMCGATLCRPDQLR